MSAFIDATWAHDDTINGLKNAIETFESITKAIVSSEPKTLNNKAIADYNQNLYAMILTMESYVDMFRITLDEQLNCENPPITRPLLNLRHSHRECRGFESGSPDSNLQLRASDHTPKHISDDNDEEPEKYNPSVVYGVTDSNGEVLDVNGGSDRENSDEFEEPSVEMDSEKQVNDNLAVAVATTAACTFPVKINSEFLVCQAGHNMEYAKHLEVYEIIAFALLTVKSSKSKMHKARQVAYQNDFNLAIKTGKEFANSNAVRVEQHFFLELLEMYFIADRQCMISAKGINLFFSMTAKAAGHNLPYQKVKKLMEWINLKNCYLEGKLYYPNISLKLRNPLIKIT